MANSIIIGVDVGLKGGITILVNSKEPLIYKMPLEKIIVNKKNKNTYNMIYIVDIFKKYRNEKVLFYIERQGVRNGEGAVSAMTIGKGFGQLLGVAYAFDFEVIVVSPVKWKKMYPALECDNISKIRVKMKDKRTYAKTLKDKELKKENKKYIEKLQRQLKAQAKINARLLGIKLYPQFADQFKPVNSDGMAESLLIALYGKSLSKEK